jgi:hypothetical protein
VWQRLIDRAVAIGRPVPQRDHNGCLPRGASEVGLVSRAQSPTDARPWLDDQRQLGVRVKRLVLRGTDETREVPMDHPDLTRGWWAVEQDGQN